MRTVLLVEPMDFKRRLVARALAAHGYQVVEVATAMAAIHAYADALPDFVVMSHHLPDLDGVTALKSLRVVDDDARVIITGPVTGAESVLAARRAGAIDFVANPLADDRLFESLGKHLSPVVA